jgi:hypothetical protein
MGKNAVAELRVIGAFKLIKDSVGFERCAYWHFAGSNCGMTERYARRFTVGNWPHRLPAEERQGWRLGWVFRLLRHHRLWGFSAIAINEGRGIG